MNRTKKRLLFAGAVITATMCAMPASAQEAETTSVGEIVVTGSRIKRQDITGVGPATVVTGEDIERTGITNVGLCCSVCPPLRAPPATRRTPIGPATATARRRSICAAWASIGP